MRHPSRPRCRPFRPLLLLLTLVTGLALTPLLASPSQAASGGGYWMLGSNGSVFNFGDAVASGSGGGPWTFVDIESAPSGRGYWLMDELGHVTNKGDAPLVYVSSGYGALNITGGERAVSLSATPTGKGLWVFTNWGRVLVGGDARSFGDMSGIRLNGPILGSVATGTGQGYWMVGSDGGIFSFGDAAFHGSTGGIRLNKPVMSMAPNPGGGYWLVASDGGIFAFDAPFYGSMGGTKLNKPISGMVPSPTGGGYLMVASDGGVFSFGDVPFYGSLGGNPPAVPVVSIAAIGDSSFQPAASTTTTTRPAPTTTTTRPPATYQDTTPLPTITGTGNTDSQPFSLTAETTVLHYSCQASGYVNGCRFALYEYATGDLVDSTYPDANTSGTFFFHPDVAGQYYLQASEYNQVTNWSASITQRRCTANCP